MGIIDLYYQKISAVKEVKFDYFATVNASQEVIVGYDIFNSKTNITTRVKTLTSDQLGKPVSIEVVPSQIYGNMDYNIKFPDDSLEILNPARSGQALKIGEYRDKFSGMFYLRKHITDLIRGFSLDLNIESASSYNEWVAKNYQKIIGYRNTISTFFYNDVQFMYSAGADTISYNHNQNNAEYLLWQSVFKDEWQKWQGYKSLEDYYIWSKLTQRDRDTFYSELKRRNPATGGLLDSLNSALPFVNITFGIADWSYKNPEEAVTLIAVGAAVAAAAPAIAAGAEALAGGATLGEAAAVGGITLPSIPTLADIGRQVEDAAKDAIEDKQKDLLDDLKKEIVKRADLIPDPEPEPEPIGNFLDFPFAQKSQLIIAGAVAGVFVFLVLIIKLFKRGE